MVAPAEQAVSCIECHSKGGRLEKLEGFYLPGRDSDATVQFIGIGAILSSLAGVLIHALLRVLASLKRSKKSSIE
jgi:hypothetical protein